MNAVDKVSSIKTLEDADLILEYMMNHLRIDQGVDATELFLATGLDLKNYKIILDDCYQKDLLVKQDEKIFTTRLGKQYLNEILVLFS